MFTVSLLAALAAAPVDPNLWWEFPTGRKFSDSALFAQIDRATSKDGKIALATLYVTRNSYLESTVTIDCAAQTVTFSDVPYRLRGSDKPNGSGVATTLGFAQSGGFGAPAKWVCGDRTNEASPINRVSGDAKARAWKTIDAFDARLPQMISETLTSAAPSLTLTVNGVVNPVSSATFDGCWFQFYLADGRKVRLDLMSVNTLPRQRSLAAGGVTLKGFGAADFEVIDYALQWIPGC